MQNENNNGSAAADAVIERWWCQDKISKRKVKKPVPYNYRVHSSHQVSSGGSPSCSYI